MDIQNLWDFAADRGLSLCSQAEIVDEGVRMTLERYGPEPATLKASIDDYILDSETEVFRVYRLHEAEFGTAVFEAFTAELIAHGELRDVSEVGSTLGRYFRAIDEFYKSLGNSRKARSGKGFERINKAFLEVLDYPFTFQPQGIDGRPDFVLPCVEHYNRLPIDCITLTAKRTLRERWRQIITEGAQGRGFFLATIDEDLTQQALDEMNSHGIRLVVPERVRAACYPGASNVLSYQQFCLDHLDPAKERWLRNGAIDCSTSSTSSRG